MELPSVAGTPMTPSSVRRALRTISVGGGFWVVVIEPRRRREVALRARTGQLSGVLWGRLAGAYGFELCGHRRAPSRDARKRVVQIEAALENWRDLFEEFRTSAGAAGVQQSATR